MSGTVPLVAGVELGGTKCIAILARGREVIEEARWPTLAPDATLPLIAAKLAAWRDRAPLAGLGIASFGPLCLLPGDRNHGRIVNTPKPGWSGTDVRGTLARGFAGPVGFDTDVAGAALAEGRWGASIGCDTHVYITIGTGVGGAVVVNGRPLHGAVHPEIGHVRVRRTVVDGFAGLCPFHGDCVEGLVSGPAITARAGEPVDHLAVDDPLWDRVGAELAELMVMLILTLSPRRIVIGGGVAERRPMLFARIHAVTSALLNGYLVGQQGHELQRMIVPPRLGAEAGPLGAIALGLSAIEGAA
jgi:fructokinase